LRASASNRRSRSISSSPCSLLYETLLGKLVQQGVCPLTGALNESLGFLAVHPIGAHPDFLGLLLEFRIVESGFECSRELGLYLLRRLSWHCQNPHSAPNHVVAQLLEGRDIGKIRVALLTHNGEHPHLPRLRRRGDSRVADSCSLVFTGYQGLTL